MLYFECIVQCINNHALIWVFLFVLKQQGDVDQENSNVHTILIASTTRSCAMDFPTVMIIPTKMQTSAIQSHQTTASLGVVMEAV